MASSSPSLSRYDCESCTSKGVPKLTRKCCDKCDSYNDKADEKTYYRCHGCDFKDKGEKLIKNHVNNEVRRMKDLSTSKAQGGSSAWTALTVMIVGFAQRYC